MSAAMIKGAVVLVAISVSTALGVPKYYSFIGVGSGVVDSQGFESSPFSITLMGNTEDIQEIQSGIFVVPGSATIHLPDFGLGNFLVTTRVFANNNTVSVGFSEGFPTGPDLLDVYEPAVAGFKLDTPVAPVYEPDPVAVDQFVNIATSLGSLTFETIDWVYFSSCIIPEPTSMLGLLVGLGIWARRRRV